MKTVNEFNWKLIWLLGALVVLAAALSADAQTRGSNTSAPPSAGTTGLSTRRGRPGSPSGASEGTPCRLIRYESLDDYYYGDVVANVVAKPIGKNTKVLKLVVPSSEKPFVCLNQHKFDSYGAQQVLRSGLYCTIDWKYQRVEQGRTPKKKELVALYLVPIDVRGTILDIDDEYVTLRARPAAGGDWPHLSWREQSSSGTGGNESTRKLKLKLRLIEDVTVFTDLKNRPRYQFDFEIGQKVEAAAVLGQKEGILVTLRALTTDQ